MCVRACVSMCACECLCVYLSVCECVHACLCVSVGCSTAAIVYDTVLFYCSTQLK